MNPYVYSKRGPHKGHAAQQAQETPTVANLIKHVMSAPISTAMAFAIVVLAAGSTAAMLPFVDAESGLDNVMTVRVAHAKAHSQVLGDSTTVASQANVVIDDSALEAGEAVATLSVKPAAFDATSGRFSATINYNVTGGSATISIGNYVVQSSVTGSGSIDTGAILKPSREYRVALWTADASGAKQILAKASIKTPKAKSSEQGDQMMVPCKVMDQANNSTGSAPVPSATPAAGVNGSGNSGSAPVMCVQNKEGKTICPRPANCAPMMKGGDDRGGMMGGERRGGKDDKQGGQGQMGGMMGGQQGQPGQQPPQQPQPTPSK